MEVINQNEQTIVESGKKVSIVMAYYNRKEQTTLTLDSLLLSAYKNFEVIIVDDASDNENKLDDVIGKYPYDIKLVRIEKEDKKWVNPCIPYNIGFKHVSGDIVIIQNPEVCHVGDILSYVAGRVNDEDYITFSVYASPYHIYNAILRRFYEKNEFNSEYIKEHFIDKIDYEDFKFDYPYYRLKYPDVKKLNYDKALNHWHTIGINEVRQCNKMNIYYSRESIEWKGWYNHPEYRLRPLHFLSAISKVNLDKLGGFDEQFKDGLWFDDDDFLERVRCLKLNVLIIQPNNLFGIHLFHDHGSAMQFTDKNFLELKRKNFAVYNDNIEKNVKCVTPIISQNVNVNIKNNRN